MGRLVRVMDARVADNSDTGAGGQLLVGDESELYKLFIPSGSGQPDMSRFERGDAVSATGVGMQYCPLLPYDNGFESCW